MEKSRREKYLDAAERAARTAVQTFAAAMVVALYTDGASWADVPTAASAGGFAAMLATLMALAGPLAPRK